MKILITGGAGYIGTELITALNANKEVDSIIVYDNLSRKNFNFFTNGTLGNKVRFVEGDLLDSRKLRQSIKDVDVVFHLGALTDKNPSLDSHLFEQVNHWGTSELMNAVEESKASRIIYTSSTAVFGGGETIFNEESDPNPKTFYATSKWRGEEQVKRLFNKIKCYNIRIGNVYGFGSSTRYDGVINKFMFDANFKGRISIHGNGRQMRSFISLQSVIAALVKLLDFNLESGTYNLTDKNLQVLDIVEVLQEIYLALEFIFINQHIKIEDLQVERDGKLMKMLNLPTSDLKQELEKFKSKFSF